jgi:MYXO-CTERM domain-containing protein
VYSGQIYDPATNTWATTASLLTARAEHTATLLPSGAVLVAGGGSSGNGGTATATAELYTGGLASGTPCNVPADCTSGFCVNGVCCTTACKGGPCTACSVSAGAAVDGTCSLLTGPACDDGNACSKTDVCQAGVCVGTNPVVCPMPDQCHVAGVCDPMTGTCSNPTKPNGTACSDGNACTQGDTCQSGACVSGPPVMCTAMDTCHLAGTCDPMTGMCSNPAKPDGSTCDDGNACSQMDVCQGGVCVGENPVVCKAMDTCHDIGVCSPMTGICSNPVKADGSKCDDGNACTMSDTCMAGTCVGGAMGVCNPPGECQEAGACNPVNGICSYPNKPDGTPCTSGACHAGSCLTSAGSSSSTGSSSGSTTGAGGGTGSSSSGASSGAGGGGTGTQGGCKCEIGGSPSSKGAWLALGLLVAAGRRGARRRSRSAGRPVTSPS